MVLHYVFDPSVVKTENIEDSEGRGGEGVTVGFMYALGWL